jgi:protein-S-isoprenylcysteine O-methyltransferase Ste14
VISLRLFSLVVYLLSWVGVAVGSLWSLRPAHGRVPAHHHPAGMLLQVAGVLVITLFLPAGPLQPALWEQGVAAVLAPAGAALYLATVAAGRRGGLVTTGPFALVRHPMYLAFFLLLGATAALAHAGWRSAPALAMYLAGSELRAAREEAALAGEDYAAYRARTRWRYFPGFW